MISQWTRLFPNDETVGPELLERWSEPHRRYHTLDHLAAMLRVVDEHADLADDPDAVRLAAWFHDAVYSPFASDNEEQSAALARTRLGALGFSAERTEEVIRLVRLTAGHNVAADDRNGALLADADLAILASDKSDYDRYAALVRAEFAAVPDEIFRPGRAAILQKLLDLPALFRVVPSRAAWTARAHDNLRAEIRTLLGAP